MEREADFKHQKSLLTLSSCEYRQDHNLIFLHDTFISKDVSQNSKSFLLGLILMNLGGGEVGNTEFQKIHFFQVNTAICEGENFTFKRKQDIIGAAICIC